VAPPQDGDTLKEILSGMSSMQRQLGLLPMQSQSQPLGIPFSAPPPPPTIVHPGEAARQAMEQQQRQLQHALQAAQITRYLPPPSTPIGGMGFGASAAPSPFAAVGGGGYGDPFPMRPAAPAFTGYGAAGPWTAPRLGSASVPGYLNPFAPQLPSAHFMTPAMQSQRILEGYQSQHAAALAAVAQGAFSVGGTLLGSTLGSAFGPLGTMAGGWLGGKIGGAMMGAAPALTDFQRGRQLEHLSSPWMVAGPMLNPFSGSGMERGAARTTATGLRNLWRDHEFEKTGFNTADVMRLTQLASDQGLLSTARSPDEITRKVKDLAKAVKNVIAITGDPDVRDAMAQLGQLRNLGFQGLASQMGAVANRAAFARMAGVSQGAMDQMYGLPGAQMGQQLGLAGATGYSAGLAGGGFANVAASTGALSDLQLARAGGKQGLGQTNAMSALGAMNQDVYLAAALRRGPGGDLGVDVDAYRAAQRLDIKEVAQRGADNLRQIGPRGVYELSTRRQEFKDLLAQKMGPHEMQLNALRQAKAMQHTVGHGMTLGAAFRTMLHSTGQYGSPEEEEQAARSLELQYESPEFYDGLTQQLRARRREAADRERSRRDQFRTPGVWSRTKRSVRGFLGDLGDAGAQPFVDLADRLDRVAEDRSLANRGERAMRWDRSQLIQTPQDRELALKALESRDFQQAFAKGGGDPFADPGFTLAGTRAGTAAGGLLGAQGSMAGMGMGLAYDTVGARNRNRLGSMFGLSNYTDANRVVDIASRSYGTSFGWHPFSSFGDVGEARARVQSVMGAASAYRQGQQMTGATAVTLMDKLNRQAEAGGINHFNAGMVLSDAAQRMRGLLPKARAELSAGAASDDLFKQAFVEAMGARGHSQEDAMRIYHSSGNKELIGAYMSRDVIASGDRKAIETLEVSRDVDAAMGAIKGREGRKGVEQRIAQTYRDVGLTGMKKETLERTKEIIKANDPRVLAYAAAVMAGDHDARAGVVKERMLMRFGKDNKAMQAFKDQANLVTAGASDDVKKAMVRVLHSGGPGTRTEDQFDRARTSIGEGMGLQAVKTVLGRLADDTRVKDLAGADDPIDAVKNLHSGLLKEIRDPKLKKAIEDVRAGKEGAENRFRAAIAAAGATSGTEIFGGERGSETDDIDRQMAEVARDKAETAKSQKPADKTQVLFASAVELFATAAKDLKGVTENMVLTGGMPAFQGER
jgi:hypothetical protein